MKDTQWKSKELRRIVRGLNEHASDTCWIGPHETAVDALAGLYEYITGRDIHADIMAEIEDEHYQNAIACGLIIDKTGEAQAGGAEGG